jgi:hypothetical protein
MLVASVLWLRATKHFLVPRELLLLKLHLVVRLVIHIVSDLVFIEPDRGDKVSSLPRVPSGNFLVFFLIHVRTYLSVFE